MTSFDFKTWYSDHGLKQKTIDKLWKIDLDSQEASKLVHADDIATLDLTLGQKKLLLHALTELNSAEKSLRLARRNQLKQRLSRPRNWRAMAVLKSYWKERKSFIKWPACQARSHQTAIVRAPREDWQQPAGVPWSTGQEGRWEKTFSYSRLC